MIRSKIFRKDYIDITYNQSKYKNIVVKHNVFERYHESFKLKFVEILNIYAVHTNYK